MACEQLAPFLKPNCLSEEVKFSKYLRMECSKIFEAITLIVMLLKSSGVTVVLLPLNLGMGVTIPRPKAEGTSPMLRKILRIIWRMTTIEGWAHLKCWIQMLSCPGEQSLEILRMALSTSSTERKYYIYIYMCVCVYIYIYNLYSPKIHW